ncbi:PDZ domain-containing protein [Marinicella sp. W31]|uniref:PDZ domain-containing protein n=1 Tax=Marinicella sp. W31 TaxID=3023713 RepID=UPI003757D1AD
MKIKCMLALGSLMMASAVLAEARKIEVTSDVDVVRTSDGQSTAKIMIKKIDGDDVQVIDKKYDIDEDTDVDALIESLLSEHDIEWTGNDDKRIIKIDTSRHLFGNHSKPRLGFMASTSNKGWEILSVTPDSGAADSGLQPGDVIVELDGESTGTEGLALQDFTGNDLTEGQMVEVLVKTKNGEESLMNIEARVLQVPDVLMGLNKRFENFGESSHNSFFSKDGDHTFEFFSKIKPDDVHVVTSKDADAYFFSRSNMSEWLGKKHHFSTITPGLGTYFGTEQGVLLLEVDPDNSLGLEDGDVIQSVNGAEVNNPKDVVRQFNKLKKDESVEIQIMRNKKKIYLAS